MIFRINYESFSVLYNFAEKTKEEEKSSPALSIKLPSSPKSSSPSASSSSKKKQTTRNLMLTGRGVTTQMLIQEQILEPGEKNLSINYLV